MQLYAYRKTEAGANRTIMARLEHERAMRCKAEQSARKLVESTRQLMVKVAVQEVELKHAAAQLSTPIHRSPFRRIEERAMKIFRMSKLVLHSNRRKREVVLARQFVMYWAVRRTTLSLPQIGRLMGGRDHTTVLHGKHAYREKRAKMGRHLKETR